MISWVAKWMEPKNCLLEGLSPVWSWISPAGNPFALKEAGLKGPSKIWGGFRHRVFSAECLDPDPRDKKSPSGLGWWWLQMPCVLNALCQNAASVLGQTFFSQSTETTGSPLSKCQQLVALSARFPIGFLGKPAGRLQIAITWSQATWQPVVCVNGLASTHITIMWPWGCCCDQNFSTGCKFLCSAPL